VHEIGRNDVGLVIIGDGDQLVPLQRLAEELDIVNYVHFTGWLSHSEIRRYLSAADAGICPDPKNGMNEHLTMVKAMEYLAMSMPIVAFDLDETRVTAADAGLYAQPNCVQDLAAKIDELLSDETRRRRMGMIARARITSALSWEHSRPILIGSYARLVGLPVEIPTSRPPELVAL
jgi:glycosyltransferase involved in cell wall biosynthesis